MPLIIEDGTMPAGANSYVSLESADAYLVPRGLWPAYERQTDNESPDDVNNDDGEEPDAPVEPTEPEKELDGNELAEPQSENESGETGNVVGEDDENPDPELPDEPEPDPDLPDVSKPDDDPEIAKKEAALMRAFDYLNGPLQWLGNKVDWQRQPAWPRENVPIPGTNPEKPEYIPNDVVPEVVCRAQMELAAFIYNGRDPLAPLERGGKYQQKSDSKSESVDVLSESESHSIAYASDAPIFDWYPSIYPLLKPLLEEVPGEVQSGFTVHNILRG